MEKKSCCFNLFSRVSFLLFREMVSVVFSFEDASVTICPVRSEELHLLTACAGRLLRSATHHSVQARQD